jgi:hypothetical protein
MKLRLLKSTPFLSCLTLITIAIQSSDTAWANRDLFNIRGNSEVTDQNPVADSAEGIEFMTLTPNESIEIPKEGNSVRIRLGIRITNNSLIERSFFLVPGLPTFRAEESELNPVSRGCASSSFIPLDLEHFVKPLKPGESIEVFNTALIYHHGEEVVINYFHSNGMSCQFSGFKPGSYSISMNYKGTSDHLRSQRNLWQGIAKAKPNHITLVGNK